MRCPHLGRRTLGILVVIVVWRRVFAAPMPRVFDTILNTRFRQRNFSPEVAAERHGLAPGMRVLEVGPAGGYLTAAAQRRIQPEGRLISIDLQLPLLKTLRTRLGPSAPPLVCGDATKLPFREGCFDLLFVVEVMGEADSADSPHKGAISRMLTEAALSDVPGGDSGHEGPFLRRVTERPNSDVPPFFALRGAAADVSRVARRACRTPRRWRGRRSIAGPVSAA
jgi:Methyltransferase domain